MIGSSIANYRSSRASRPLPRLFLTISLLFASSLSYAQLETSPSDSQLASQRFHYQKAKQALSDNDQGVFDQHYQGLGDYPLRPYLEFTQIKGRLSELPFTEVDEFLGRYPNSFLAERLRVRFLFALAKKERWIEYLQYYRGEISSTTLACHAITARLALGDVRAYDDVPQYWLAGKSQPDACDPVFRSWTKAGKRSEDLVWARMVLAVQAGNSSLAGYLAKKLDTLNEQASLFLKVHRQPSLVTQRDLFKRHDIYTQQIIAHGIQRLARKEPLSALYHWELYEAQQIFPESLSLATKLQVVKRLIRGGHAPEAQHLLAYSHQLREQTLVEEVIRDALKIQDWARVRDGIALLDEESQTSERWTYWRARAQDELNEAFSDFPKSEEVYRDLAQNRSFYGFSSADRLAEKYSLVDKSSSTTVDPIRLVRLSQLPGMQRAYELWLTGNYAEAQAEWLYTSKQMAPDDLLIAGQIADQWGWHASGIRAMINGNWWNQLTVRFPIAYQDEVAKISADTQVEPTFIYAIARQESAFDSQARSPVGAMGLMQLMPQTASFTAKTFGIPHSKKSELYDAEHNMRLGSHYLNYLLKKFNGNRILAAAAYNAGPHRVNKWLSEDGQERPFDVWIETIPYGETRQYVQNVLCFSVIYGYRLGQPVKFISNLEANSYL